MAVLPAGILAKIERADEHIQQLNSEIAAFLSANTYRTISKLDPDTGERVLYLVGPDPPLRFSVIIGEITYHLRTTLDHLICHLVLKNEGTPSRRHQFPICDSIEKYKDAIKKGNIEGITASCVTVIETLQPYHAGADFKRNLLWILQDMNNTDKHRLLITVSGIASTQCVKIAADRAISITQISAPQGFVRATESGTELYRFTIDSIDAKVLLEGDLTPDVALDKFGEWQNQPVIPSMKQLHDSIVGAASHLAATP